ncbi:hypothetical protein GY45DRAFT_1332474, partial [Cubamyces sp. BRFM 1775]
MSDFGFNVWGAIAAVVGTASLIPVFIAWLNTCLPRALLPGLESLLHDTQRSFVTGLREGLFTDDPEIHKFHVVIRTIKGEVDEACAEGYGASTWRQDVRHWYRGLSGKISDICLKLNDIRANLAKVQSGKRKLLEAQGYPAKRSISPYSMELLQEYPQGLILPLTSRFTPLACSELCTPTPNPQVQTSPLTSEPSASAPVAYNEPECGPRTPSLCSQSQSSRTSSLFSYDEERHLISDADLRGLVFLGLSLLRSRQSSGYGEVPSEKAQQASPQGAPRPVSNNGLYAQRQSKLAIRRAKRTGIKADLLY